MVKLSRRLKRLADMITKGNRLADVGTDHGYVPIYLCEQNKIPSAIAMDVNRGPLERAKAHIQEAGLTAYIETRLGDGLDSLGANEADAVLIAGMGGPLTVRILTRGRAALCGVRELILQPQSEIAGVRRWLLENGYRIVQEDMVQEDGKYYPMFRAVSCEGIEEYSEEEYHYGRLEIQRSHGVLREFLEKRLAVQEQILEGLQEQGRVERLRRRRAEIEQELGMLRRTLERLREWKI